MKNRLLIVIIILFESVIVSGNTNNNYTVKSLLLPPQIDTTDKIVFDMANADITGNFVDVPVYFLSNDLVVSLDFAIRFDNVKLTFDSVINYKSYLGEFAHYNPTDSTLRLTSSTSNINDFHPIENNTPLFAVRFHFNVPNACNKINKKDFHSVSLALLNGDGCGYEIIDIPKIDFDRYNACIGDNTFKPISFLKKDTITAWFWNFGNGSVSNSRNPVVTYTTASTYTVTLITTTGLGCVDSARRPIKVNSTPVPNFTYLADCKTGNIVFTDLSTITSGSINEWEWNFGDDSITHLRNPIYDYVYGGVYSVSLTTTSDSGCISTYKRNVNVDIFNAYFKKANGCVGEVMNFHDSSTFTATSGPITNWKWYFGDANTTTTTRNPSYIYNKAGTYMVSLKVSNANCSDSIANRITIENKPIVKFGIDKISGCMPLTVSFNDSSVIGSASTYVWNFGDIIDTSSSKHIMHTYTSNGIYNVKHYVTTSAGCTDSLEKTSSINVFGVTASFIASSYKVKLPDGLVKFTNRSNSYSNWTWNFGDSIYSSDKTPEHTYTEAGVYSVCLSGLNSNGCSSNYCDTITVDNPNIIAIPQAFTPNGDNVNDVLRVRGGPVKELELRIYNEWGNLLFLSNAQSDGWDGNYNGAPQGVGIYEYTVKGKTVDNETISMHGVVNLIR